MKINKSIDCFFFFLCVGKQIERDPSIDRLIEIRTVLEKIRPIDYKLRYQIDKLVKTAITGAANVEDPINFRVRFDFTLTHIPIDRCSHAIFIYSLT